MKKLIQLSLVTVALISALAMALPDNHPSAQSKPADNQQRYLGSEACAACHTEIFEKQRASSMAKAMEKGDSCQILARFTDLKFQQGKFTYRIERQGNQSLYIVSDGTSTISIPLLYCFGQGKAGQTYVYEYKGVMHESRLSFYTEISGLDITLGHAAEAPDTLVEAAGRRMPNDETQRCFTCHTAGAMHGSQLRLANAEPGVRCESCHGPGGEHVAAIRAGEKAPAKMKRLGDLDGDDITQNMCGSCHRSVEDVIALPSRGGIGNVRFQPYRIFNSRCYSADKRIGCTACHDPHAEMQHRPAYYDSRCLSCHQSKNSVADKQPAGSVEIRDARACKVANQNCASCHMPKIDVPGAHFKFTDHRIRIVREGEPFPN